MKNALARVAAVLAACALTSVGAHAANLLTNAGAESGDISGWTAGGDGFATVDTGTFNSGIVPHSGSYAFLGRSGAFDTLTQTVSLAGLGAVNQATVSFWEQGLDQGTPSDDAYVSLTYRGAANQVLGMVTTATIDSHNLTWQNYSGSFAIPTGTASIDYTMNFVRNHGSDNDSYIDDNVLTVSAVPEPSTVVLAGLGLLVVGAKARRSRKA